MALPFPVPPSSPPPPPSPASQVDLIVDDSFTFSHSGSGNVHVLGYMGELEKPDDDAEEESNELELEAREDGAASCKGILDDFVIAL